ncbi:MAG: thioredoxin [Clostridiales bacterium]|nr:thioredoxin [Clostridiales bacterium]
MVEVFTEENFAKRIIQAKEPVLVDFYADWCGPCRKIGPVMERLAEKYEGKLIVGKVNVDENPGIAREYHVQSIPYLVLFSQGEVKETSLGAVSSRTLEEMIHRGLENFEE